MCVRLSTPTTAVRSRDLFASMDTPGPFEKKATQAYYYVTPVEGKLDEKQKNEWLTSFNYYTTDVTSIHEAYPGHYVQFLAPECLAGDEGREDFRQLRLSSKAGRITPRR